MDFFERNSQSLLDHLSQLRVLVTETKKLGLPLEQELVGLINIM